MKKLLNTALLLFAVLMTSCTAPNAGISIKRQQRPVCFGE